MACMVRMRAHGADLGETGKAQPLTGHGYQLSFPLDAQIHPEAARADAKRAWPSHFRESEHFRRICGGHRNDLFGNRRRSRPSVWRRATFVNHLKTDVGSN